MATPLKPEKIVTRETAVVYRGRPLLVELHPAYLTLREKGRQFRLSIDYRTILDTAYKMLYKAQQAEKAAKRNSKSK
jgi:hypothetical protein